MSSAVQTQGPQALVANHYDVIVVGAGISGLSTAQVRCP